MQFYELFEELCIRDGVSPRKATTDMGFGNSVAATWKYRGSVPTTFNMRKIAKYFDVSLEDLLNYENINDVSELKKPAPELNIVARSATPLEAEIDGAVRKLPVVNQELLLKYIQFTYPEAFDEK